jgi:hypothetical protein
MRNYYKTLLGFVLIAFGILYENKAFCQSQVSLNWSKGLFAGTSGVSVSKIKADLLGNVIITGYFQNTIDFDPGPGVLNLSSFGGRDIYIAKYSPTGSLIFAFAQPGAIDLTFNPTDIGVVNGDGPNGQITKTSIQSDGKIIISGQFTIYSDIARNRIARINTNGMLDAS